MSRKPNSQIAIRKEKEQIRGRIRALEGEIAIQHAHWNVLIRRCSHPNMRKYSAMGEVGNICDDCGYQD